MAGFEGALGGRRGAFARLATLRGRRAARTRRAALAPGLAGLAPAAGLAVLGIALGGCGDSTRTVSVGQAPAPAGTTANRSASSASTTTGATGATGARGGAGGGTGTSSAGAGGTPAATTRTAPAPAFVERGAAGAGSGTAGASRSAGSAAGLSSALEVVRARGYSVKDTSDYHPDQTLRVLIGTGARSNDGYDRRAFFFLNGRYLGTDSSGPSAQLSVVSQGDTEVTLAYALYRPGDPLCCPGAGRARVRFQLNDGRLVALDPIPPASSASAPSRQ